MGFATTELYIGSSIYGLGHHCYTQTLKRKYISKMLHAMVKNPERYDELRAVGVSIPVGVRRLNHAYPPNLLDVATIVYEVWESIGKTTLVNCWLKADIFPACHVECFETYRHPLELPAVEELLQHMTINSQVSIQDENDHPSPTIGREQLIGEFVALRHQAQNDPAGLADLLNNWPDIEVDNLLRHEEVEIALGQEKVQPAMKRQWRLTLAAVLRWYCQKIHQIQTQYAAGVMASSSAWRTASTREEIMDISSCFV